MFSRPRLLPSLFATLFVAGIVSQAASCALDQYGSEPPSSTEACADDVNCDDKDQCTKNVCGGNKVCEYKPVDGLAPEQMAGDCRQGTCTAGVLSQINDDSDLPDDLESCTTDSCANGEPVHAPLVDGSPCTLGELAGLCKAGKCTVECSPQKPCNDGKPCTEDTCNASTGTCTFATLDGLPTPGFVPVPGDCSQQICVNGVNTTIPDDFDLPSSDICKKGSCSMGMPSYTYMNSGAPCNPDGSGACNDMGVCMECAVAEDCPTPMPNNGCKVPTCTNNKCGEMLVAAGTEVPSKTGDCKKLVCDGAGGATVQNDDADVPFDSNLCTQDLCTNGVPMNPPEAMGKECGGTKTCNATGQCTGCTTDEDCGPTNDCITSTCDASNQCVITYQPQGTATTDQAVGDCKTNQCDGMGNVVTVVNAADAPSDGNDCTLESCNAQGMPSSIFAPLNAMCSQNGGTVCNGFGSCLDALGGGCADGTECASGFCIDGVCCADTCTAECMACNVPMSLGTCTNVPANTDDAPLCTGTNSCNGMGACKRDDGQPCGNNSECSSGFCADGVCCDSACGETCKSCNLVGAVGVCSFVPNDTVDPTGMSPCNNPYRCDGKGACKALNSVTCNQASDCLSGYCVDNYCCNNICNQTCKACAGMLTGGNNGACGFILNATDPQNECPTGECNGAGVCTGGGGGNNLPNGAGCANGSQCLSSFCVDGVCCNAACTETCKSCNVTGSVGTCTNIPNDQQDSNATTPCNNPYRCDGAGVCKALNSVPCTMPSQCLSGYCVDGFCCNNICDGLCRSCSSVLNAGADGTCGFTKAGSESNDECPNGACNGSGMCTP
ncbi:MAG: hypothetical protein IPM54_03060 [Polyangiaceae bacterium]|nr:hypothetical protein [Polyangiaceae bacterium]